MNLLPNTNWQLYSTNGGNPAGVTAMREDGTALQSAITITGFTPNHYLPYLTSNDTKELRNGDMLVFGFGLAGLSNWALRVFNLTPNVGFNLAIPFSKLTPGASSVITAYPVGMVNTTGTYGPDGGWSKTASVCLWIDDFPSNRAPGAKRVLGLRKTVSGPEVFKWKPRRAADVDVFQGRSIALGAWVRQKVGSGTRMYAKTAGGSMVYSSATVASYSNPATNNHQFLSLTADNVVEIGWELGSSIGDMVYLGLPTAKYGTAITPDELGQPVNELIIADTHWNPPSLTPLVGNWPGGPMIGNLYGWILDLPALSGGQVHDSVRKVSHKIEYSGSHTSLCFTAALDISAVQLTFGAQTPALNGVVMCSSTVMLPLMQGLSSWGSPRGCFALFSATPNGVISNLTFDFDDVVG